MRREKILGKRILRKMWRWQCGCGVSGYSFPSKRNAATAARKHVAGALKKKAGSVHNWTTEACK